MVLRCAEANAALRATSSGAGAEYLSKTAEIAAELEPSGDEDWVQELQSLLRVLPEIEVVQGQMPWPPSDDAPEGMIYEVTSEFMASLRAQVNSPAHLMREAFYTLACDYNLEYHLLWPVYRRCSNLVEPFAAYFDLWKHGAGCRFGPDGGVKVYVPNLEGYPGIPR